MEKNIKGLVYFLKENGTGAIKIGASTKKSLRSRISALNTSMPYGSDLIGTIETDDQYELERKFHNVFKDHRLNGEFFNISEYEVIDFIHGKYELIKDVKKSNNKSQSIIKLRIMLERNQNIKRTDLAKQLGVSRNTLYQYLKIINKDDIQPIV